MAMGGAWWAKRVKILLIASAAPMASARQVCLGGACHGRGEVERLPWQLGGRRVREVERLSEADNKREVGPRGGPVRAVGQEACQEGPWGGGEGSWRGGPGGKHLSDIAARQEADGKGKEAPV